MQTYEVDEGYVPSQAVLEVLEWVDENDRILKANGKMLDYFLEEIASHSKDCMCSKCEKDDDSWRESVERREEFDRSEADRHNAPSEGFNR